MPSFFANLLFKVILVEKLRIEKLIQKAEQRIRLHRFLRLFGLSMALGLGFAIIDVLCIRHDAWTWHPLHLLIFCVPLFILFVYAKFSRISKLGIAQEIDTRANLSERLSSAYAFLQSREKGEWIEAQISDANKYIDSISLKSLFPTPKPLYFWIPFVALALLLLAIFVPLPHFSEPPKAPILEAEDPIEESQKFRKNIESGTAKLRDDQIAALVKEAELAGDEQQIEAAKALQQLLKEDQEEKVSPEEFAQRLEDLMKSFAKEEVLQADEQAKFDEVVREAARNTQELNSEPETEQLSKALKENDLVVGALVLEDLLKQMEDGSLNSEKLQKLAKAFEKLAEQLDPTDPQLREAIKKNQSLLDTLNKKLEKNAKLTSKEQKSLEEAQEKAKEHEDAQAEAKNSPEGKELEKLKDAFEKSAEAMNKKAEKQDSESKGEENKNSQQQGQEGQQQGQEGQQQGQEGQQQGQEGQQQGQEGQQQGQEGQQQGQEGQQQGQEGQQQGQEGQQQGQEGGEAYEQMKSEASARKAQENAKELEKLARKMQEDAKRSQGDKENESQAQEDRNKNVEEFMKRAKGGGDEKSASDEETSKEQGKQGGGSEEGAGETGSQEAQAQTMGSEPGTGHKVSEGSETELDAKWNKSEVKGQLGKGQTTAEIIETVGNRGFANEAYREVFQNYESAAEEVMEKDKVPQGYRHYIDRYFDFIRPQM